jgi:O-antigen ligase
VRVFWFSVVLCCAVLLLGTKSRTAFLALTAGALAYGWIRFHTILARIATIAVIALGILYAVQHRETITDTMSLDEKERSIETGTGRYEIWRFLLTTVIPENPWLGIGPGQHTDLVLAATGSTNSHNGFLTSLSDTGIIGTFPLLLLTGFCLRAAWQRRKRPEFAWVSAIFIAGVVESLGESVFFSIGNPASLLFMLSVAALSMPPPPETECDPARAPVPPAVPNKLVLGVAQ